MCQKHEKNTINFNNWKCLTRNLMNNLRARNKNQIYCGFESVSGNEASRATGTYGIGQKVKALTSQASIWKLCKYLCQVSKYLCQVS